MKKMLLLIGWMALFAAVPAMALNPQPEVPSKNPVTHPKALNPQPEVPSKGEKINRKALNPQPEVPSKPKKKKRKTGGKANPPETGNRQ
ncbi:MAG: hypothetical protein E4G97_03200 [Deltaproteobacteria bacterium]|nr:MAG: hypothetical protein E4G97_03200 [Deltaproteobacteria bacterium]